MKGPAALLLVSALAAAETTVTTTPSLRPRRRDRNDGTGEIRLAFSTRRESTTVCGAGDARVERREVVVTTAEDMERAFAFARELDRRGATTEQWMRGAAALDRALSAIEHRVVRRASSVVAPTEPGEEALLAVDVVLASRSRGDGELQDRLQDAMSAALPDALSRVLVVSLQYPA